MLSFIELEDIPRTFHIHRSSHLIIQTFTQIILSRSNWVEFFEWGIRKSPSKNPNHSSPTKRKTYVSIKVSVVERNWSVLRRILFVLGVFAAVVTINMMCKLFCTILVLFVVVQKITGKPFHSFSIQSRIIGNYHLLSYILFEMRKMISFLMPIEKVIKTRLVSSCHHKSLM